MNNEKAGGIFATGKLIEAMRARGKKPAKRLGGLAIALSSIEREMVNKDSFRQTVDDIQAHDLELLRKLITPEVDKAGVPHQELITEQILMVLVGTLQMEARNDTSVSWTVAENAIEALLQNSKRSLFLRYVTPLMACLGLLGVTIMGYQLIFPPKLEPKELPVEPLAITSLDPQVPSPYVPSHFYTMRQDIAKLKCQYPQAAMLPEAQRSAFLQFINTGEIAITDLTNLQLALSKVHCTYPSLTGNLNKK
ncbi:hypothetical protein ACIKP9_07020 [Methylobacillus methanolivorans]|uniref:Uncharacterized protein n=1 Tax=Methylobacillus methanolivorans TaxID=1848927 RepID=A0ABW8GKS9_9PROT